MKASNGKMQSDDIEFVCIKFNNTEVTNTYACNNIYSIELQTYFYLVSFIHWIFFFALAKNVCMQPVHSCAYALQSKCIQMHVHILAVQLKVVSKYSFYHQTCFAFSLLLFIFFSKESWIWETEIVSRYFCSYKQNEKEKRRTRNKSRLKHFIFSGLHLGGETTRVHRTLSKNIKLMRILFFWLRFTLKLITFRNCFCFVKINSYNTFSMWCLAIYWTSWTGFCLWREISFCFVWVHFNFSLFSFFSSFFLCFFCICQT